MRLKTPKVAPCTIPPSDVVNHELLSNSLLSLTIVLFEIRVLRTRSILLFDSLIGDGKDMWLIAIIDTDIVISRPRRLAILFWFIRRKYRWYNTSAWTLRNLCERKTRLHSINIFHQDPFEWFSKMDSTSSCSPSLESPIGTTVEAVWPFNVFSCVNLCPSDLQPTLLVPRNKYWN